MVSTASGWPGIGPDAGATLAVGVNHATAPVARGELRARASRMGLSASVAPSSASWRHMASIIGCRKQVPGLADHDADDLAGFGSPGGGKPVARSWVTSLRQLGESFEQAPFGAHGVKDRAAQVIHHSGIGREGTADRGNPLGAVRVVRPVAAARHRHLPRRPTPHQRGQVRQRKPDASPTPASTAIQRNRAPPEHSRGYPVATR